METAVQIVHDLIMARQTLINTEKVRQGFVHILRIRVQFFSGNVPMAILAGDLAMGRNVKFGFIYQPRWIGFTHPERKDRQSQQYDLGSFQFGKSVWQTIDVMRSIRSRGTSQFASFFFLSCQGVSGGGGLEGMIQRLLSRLTFGLLWVTWTGLGMQFWIMSGFVVVI
jgi:hypothetical protein